MHQVSIGADIRERLTQRRGRFHLYDHIDPRKSAFIVIDMQNAFCAPGAPAEVPASRGIVDRINHLAAALRKAGGDVVWIVSEFGNRNGRSDWENFFNYIVAAQVRERTMAYMAPGAEGTKLWQGLDARAEDTHLVKNRYSCLAPGASQLERVLRSRGTETLLIGGTKTNICCETTSRDAFDMDFKVVLVEDCCAALSDREHLATLENIIQQFGDVLTADEVIARFDASVP
jgi:ureidoacrylate peracid hydrolase